MIASNPLVSIIIPCYNQGRFLGEAIESALQQSYPRLEVIVVDDGSTDHTPDVVAGYPEVVSIRQENQGVSAARNRGAHASTGNYLVFLDGDDRLLSHALETGMKQLQDHAECAFVFGRHREIGADGSVRPAPLPSVVEDDHYRRLLLSNYIYTPSATMFRRAVFETVSGFDPLFSGAEDYELYLRIARQFPVFGYEEIVTEYRRHDGNKSQDYAQMLKACRAVLRKQRRYLRGNKEWKEASQNGIRNYRRVWSERLVSQVWAHLWDGREWRCFLQEMLVLMRYGPDVLARQLGLKLYRHLIGVWNLKDLRKSGLE